MQFVISPRRLLLPSFFFLFILAALNQTWGQTCPSGLTYGQTASCALGNVGETDYFTFTAEAGDRVVITVGRTLGAFELRMELNGPTGPVACASTSSSNWVQLNGCLLPSAGTYTISVWDYGNDETGNYGIYLQRVNGPGNSSPLGFGQTLSSNISVGTETDTYTFSGTTGDRVMISGTVTLGLLDPQVRLYGPDGVMLCQAQSTSGGMVEINDCPLPADGTYTILFADYDYSETGNYGIYLQKLNNPPGAIILNYGQNISGDISLVPEMDTYTFSGVAGDQVFVSMAVTLGALDPQIRLYRPDGTPLCAGTVYGAWAEINGCLLPVTGSYTLMVNDVGGADTGSYRVFFQKLTGAANPIPISFGLPMTGDISLAAELDAYTFTATAGDRVLISMAVSSGSLDPQIRLYGPTGSQVCQAQSNGPGAAEINDCPLPASGTYQIMAGDNQSTETGNYGIFLQRLNQPGNATTITYGQNITRDIILVAEMDTFTFTGTANDRVLIDMAVTLGGMEPQIRLYRPDGTLLCSNSSSGGSTEINHCILPETGTYTILAQDNGNIEAGSYRIYLQRLSNPANATPISFGQNLGSDIALAAEMDAYTFTANPGDRVLIAVSVSSGSMNPQVRLYDQEGTPVCQASLLGSGTTAETNNCQLTVGGTQTIITGDTANTRTGNYRIYIQRLNNPSGHTPLAYGQTRTGDIIDPAEMDTFTFFGEVGERVLINMAVTLGTLDPQIRLYRPDGSLICSNYSASGGFAEINNCNLPTTGSYTLLAGDYENAEPGTYQIHLQRPGHPAGATAISFGQTYGGDIALAAEMDAYTFNASTNDRVIIALAVASGTMDPQIRLHDPSGSPICQDFNTSGGFAEIENCPLPTDGIYTVLVNDYGSTETGNYRLFSQRLNNPVNVLPLGFGVAVEGEITQTAEMKTYTYQANAGDRVIFSLKANSGGLDPQIRVYRPNGTLLCPGFSSNGGTAQTSACEFPESGVYTILANDYGDTDTGGFTLFSRLPESGLLDITPPTNIASSGPASGPFSPSSGSYTLRNIGLGTINWAVSKTQPWINLSESSGILAAGETKSISITINQEARNLPSGLYQDTLTINNTTNGNGNTTRSVTLTVDPPATGILGVSPASGFIVSGPRGGPFSPSASSYVLGNIGTQPINWTASKARSWLSLSETTGVLQAGETKTVTLSINQQAGSLTTGDYSDTVSFINTTNGKGNTTRSVSLTVEMFEPVTRIFLPLLIKK